MKFQIEKLIIWPESEQFAPREVTFELGKLNVITGASRTGKSAIIPIIDYCLAAGDCFIPIDTIRDYASWYGIIVQTAAEKILFARRVPVGNTVSNDFFVIRGEEISIPPKIEEASHRANDVKLLLNTLAATPFFSVGDEDDQNYKARLSFRDLMALVFQSQEIVANQNILFYKTHAHEHRERLRNWFPYILGAETIDTLKARHQLREVEARLKKLRRDYADVSKVSSGWMANMRGHLSVAQEYGLVREDIPEGASPEHLLNIAKNILEDMPDRSLTASKNIDQSNQEIAQIERQEEELSEAIGMIKKRLGDVERLHNSFVDYGGGVKKRVDRLHISKWLRDIAEEPTLCPVCGSGDHPASGYELEKICSVFEKYEQSSKRMAEVPTSFDREEILLKKDLSALLEKKNALQKHYNLILVKDTEAQRDFQKRKNMYMFLGHLDASLEIFEGLSDGGEIKATIEGLEKEQDKLLKLASREQVRRAVEMASSEIAQNTLGHLKTLDVEEKYRKVAPKFSVTDLSVAVLSDGGNWHFLAEVGSASNWVSFHLALMCGLQEFFLSKETSVVPSFVIFDQPSQVYFPKLKKGAEDVGELGYETDEDVEAVKSMFKTLSESISQHKGEWQGIVLDHADDSVYGDLEGIHEVETWRNGNKLIPEEWYKSDVSE
jgi:hypothetical protein